jgi:hypothetical protein
VGFKPYPFIHRRVPVPSEFVEAVSSGFQEGEHEDYCSLYCGACSFLIAYLFDAANTYTAHSGTMDVQLDMISGGGAHGSIELLSRHFLDALRKTIKCVSQDRRNARIRVEEGSKTSTVTLRVVEGAEKEVSNLRQ